MKNYLIIFVVILFSTITFALNINILSPQENAQNVDIRTSFRWQTIDAEGKELRYKIYISEDANIDEKDLKLENIFSNFYTGDVLKPETTYYWKVEGVDQDGNVYSSKTAKFTTRSLRAGDAYIIIFEEFDKILPLDDDFLGISKNKVELMNANKVIVKTVDFEQNIENGFLTSNAVFLVTQSETYIFDYSLEKREQLNVKIKGLAGENIFYSENEIFSISDDFQIQKQIDFNNIQKALVKDGYIYLLTENKFVKMNSNFETVENFDFNGKTFDFDYLEIQNMTLFPILANNNITLLDTNLQKISQLDFQIETQRYQRKIYTYYDKIVLLSGSKNLNFYDSELNLIRTFTYEENFNYFVPVNKDRFILVGESIKSFNLEGNLVWNYSTINKFQIIDEPLVYDKGLMVGVKDFLTRFLIFYDDFDSQYYFTRYIKEKMPLPQMFEEIVTPPTTVTIPATPITPQATEITAEPTPITIPEPIEEAITAPSTPVDITVEPTPSTPQATEITPEPTQITVPEPVEETITVPSTPIDITVEPTPSTPQATETTPEPTQITIPEPLEEEDITAPSTPVDITVEPTPSTAEATELTKIFSKSFDEYIYGSLYDGENFYLYGYEGKNDNWDAKTWKMDPYGNILNETSLYAQNTDFFRDAILTKDSTDNTKNIIYVGDTLSYGLNGNAYIVSLTEDGSVNYQIDYGDIGRDSGISITNIDENSYAVTGNLFINKKLSDIFVSKYLNDGTRIWTNNFGGNDVEIALDIKNSQDQGFMVFGATRSFGAGGFDVYVLKIDYYGNMKWSNVYGDSNDNIPVGVIKEGRKYYVLFETSSTPMSYGILEVDELNGFGDSFEFSLDGSNKFLGFTTIDEKYLAYGYSIENGKKVGIIYEINFEEEKVEKINTYTLDSDFEIISISKPENQNSIYIFGNTTINGINNIVLIMDIL
ncbi:hypothetical protein HWHPT5561_02045 [Petrotoga sp. HWH.PT.55.6.1]|uniref:hypothetical protein n=1 Tax=unclassified Petrotoga TaxID=2620614 RepID=UPI000CA08EBD|nr:MULTISPECIES: hypothetical protein [unclassified Petrotoga]PNR94294.1 hypothetical protein X926_00635 [Petrotoga sp. HWHPT.55.6.3]RPD36367.1 hypothetical protein HWHPT5561_02045 [Petrotoga sp. HWH.PT.55.6.1]